MNEIVKILMERDGMTRNEAVNLVNETATLIDDMTTFRQVMEQ